jgi:hypothetical protein
MVCDGDGHFGRYRRVDLGPESMTYPTSPHIGHGNYTGDLLCSVAYFIDDLGFHTVQDAGEYGPYRLPHDPENCRPDDEPDETDWPHFEDQLFR